jgi:hypothetical protein
MANKLRVLFDVNVVLDVFQKREPFYLHSAQVMALVENGVIEGLLPAHSATKLFHLLKRGLGTGQARALLGDLLAILKTAPVDHSVLERALSLDYADFEDAVQMSAALAAGASHMVTRDISGFSSGPLPAVTPGELLTLLDLE